MASGLMLSTAAFGCPIGVQSRPIHPLDFEIVRRAVGGAPRLVPIYGHRYIPSVPYRAGNPVFSVRQTDIVVYGHDLADYFHRGFGILLLQWAAKQPRQIQFWSDALTWREHENNYENQ